MRHAVFYQIFPERYANGDPTNDPPGALPWASVAPTRENFFGGDLQGIIDHLDHIADLGATALYLTPIFQARTNHRYDTTDYHRIDPHLGDLETFRRLVREAHARGIRIVLDAVFNHCGNDHPAFTDVVARGTDSPYVNWFYVEDLPVRTEPVPNYATCGGATYLPRWNVHNPDVHAYLFDVTRRWTAEGIDGWRLDVPYLMNFSFWRRFREFVKGIDEKLYIVAEVWDVATEWVRGDTADKAMNCPLRDLILGFVADRKLSARAFADGLAKLADGLPATAAPGMLNLLGSHDTERVLTRCRGDRATPGPGPRPAGHLTRRTHDLLRGRGRTDRRQRPRLPGLHALGRVPLGHRHPAHHPPTAPATPRPPGAGHRRGCRRARRRLAARTPPRQRTRRSTGRDQRRGHTATGVLAPTSGRLGRRTDRRAARRPDRPDAPPATNQQPRRAATAGRARGHVQPLLPQFLAGVGATCHREGLTILLVPPLRGSMLKAIPYAAADGFIVCKLEADRGEITTLTQRGVPMVLVDGEPVPDVSAVEVDDGGGARAVCEYLLGLGHRRISILAFEAGVHETGPRYRGPLARRLEGITDALAEAGLRLDSPGITITEAPCNRDGGQQAFRRLWARDDRPTAILALSDILALSVLDAAREAGVSVPRDLSVTGFDDQPEASWTTPGLTTVRQPAESKGPLAADLLVDSVHSRLDHAQQRRLPTTLVLRGSVGPVSDVRRGAVGDGASHNTPKPTRFGQP